MDKIDHFFRGFIDREGNPIYNIWTAVVTEVELDVLTGETNIKRLDFLEDTGTSCSPEIDIGQLEGGIVMSLGFWLHEQVRYNPDTGALLTRDSWVRLY